MDLKFGHFLKIAKNANRAKLKLVSFYGSIKVTITVLNFEHIKSLNYLKQNDFSSGFY